MPKKTKAKPVTLVTFLLDKSGSMLNIKGATIEGFNAYLFGLKEEKEAAIELTFLTFDYSGGCQIDKICVAEPVANVSALTDDSYVPRGGTPLVEAAFKTITATEAALAKRDDKPKVIICIQTDGEENQSGFGFSWEALSALVKQKTEAGWQFNFMGAGIDAYNQGAKMGFNYANTVSYGMGAEETASAFRSTASNSALYASGAIASTQYSMQQKMEAGDKFMKDEDLNKVVVPVP